MFKVTMPIYISKDSIHDNSCCSSLFMFSMIRTLIFGILEYVKWYFTMALMYILLKYDKVMHCFTCSFTNGIPISLDNLLLIFTKNITFPVCGIWAC